MKKVSFAIDLGTTNIEIAMTASGSKDIISGSIVKNPQTIYGSDVINRISAVIKHKENLQRMKSMVLTAIKDVIAQILERHGYDTSNVDKICICGNTAMISIIMEYDISELGFYPFNHFLDKSIEVNADELFFDFFPKDTRLLLSGCAGAFIGGDILAGAYYIEKRIKKEEEKTWLLLDLGTNGEILLKHRGRYYGASTACGPAFEGCTRKQKVYGCSTIEAIALGLAAGKIDKNGRLDTGAEKNDITISGVILNQDIIWQIMLAKAGIYTGIELLMEYAGADRESISEVYISGGFGFNLRVENATDIGLIPSCFTGKIVIMGNSSLKGAVELLDDIGTQPFPIDKYDIDILQLANDKKFQDRLLDNLYFARK